MDMKEKKIEGNIIYDGKVVKVVRDKVLTPNNTYAYREIIKHNGGAAVLCVNDKDEIILEKQYRYAYDEVLFEIPAGKLEKDEDPYEAALRELEEETGFKANSLDFLGVIYPTCGYSNEKIYIYLAKDYKRTNTHFDEDEVIESSFISLKNAKEMVINGMIKDAKTICAINYYCLKYNK